MEASERVNAILKKMDVDATDLKKNLVKYLVQIEGDPEGDVTSRIGRQRLHSKKYRSRNRYIQNHLLQLRWVAAEVCGAVT